MNQQRTSSAACWNSGLALHRAVFTLSGVLGVYRFIGLLNAAVWLGAAVFFTFGIGTAVFSEEMKSIFVGPYRDYYPGLIAQVFLKRYFALHMICGVVALAVFCAEWFYTRRGFQKLTFVLLMIPFSIGIIAGVMQPKMRDLHQTKYTSTGAQRDEASKTFSRMHAVSSTLNLISLALLIAYMWRVANPPEPARFVSTHKFRG
jgi:hypothetical protein